MKTARHPAFSADAKRERLKLYKRLKKEGYGATVLMRRTSLKAGRAKQWAAQIGFDLDA